MAATLKITEGAPSAYPAISGLDLSDEALAAAWQRVEGWIAFRWNERTVECIAEGPGTWRPPLTPSTISTLEIWRDNAWEAITLDPAALGGYSLEAVGPYRFTGTVGENETPPEVVVEAVRRLASYTASAATMATAVGLIKSFQADDLNMETTSPNAVARALQYSGAADLLRPYRNIGGF